MAYEVCQNIENALNTIVNKNGKMWKLVERVEEFDPLFPKYIEETSIYSQT